MDKRNIHFLTFLIAFSLIVSVFTVPGQAQPIWPDWDEATACPDSTNDASPGEDMDFF